MRKYGSDGGDAGLFLLTVIFVFLCPPLGLIFLIMFLLDWVNNLYNLQVRINIYVDYSHPKELAENKSKRLVTISTNIIASMKHYKYSFENFSDLD